MINKEKILCKKSFIQKNMMINKKREKNITFNNIGISLNKINKQNFDFSLHKFNNTISYNKSKYINIFSNFNNDEKNLRRALNIRKNKTEIFSDKLIQTSLVFNNARKAFIKNVHLPLNISRNIPIINMNFQNRNKLNKIKIASISKPINKSINLSHKKIIHNQIFPIRNSNKKNRSKNKTINY